MLHRASDEQVEEAAKWVADIVSGDQITILMPDAGTWKVLHLALPTARAFRTRVRNGSEVVELPDVVRERGREYANLGKALYEIKKGYKARQEYLSNPETTPAFEEAAKAMLDSFRS